MRAAMVTAFGGFDVLAVREVPDPVAGSGGVRIRIEASGVSFADLLVWAGLHPERRRPPFIPGWDFVGRIDAVGPGVSGLKVGDRVAGLPVFGGHAQLIAVGADTVVPVPDGIDPTDAVTIVMDYVVAWQMMKRLANVAAGDALLVHGAAGGVGTAALQLAALAKSRAFGTARQADLAAVRDAGATPIDADTDDFVSILQDAGGADLVLDGIGGSHLIRSVRAARSRGMVIFFGMTSALAAGQGQGLRSLAGWLVSAMTMSLAALPIGPRLVLYSIQRTKRLHPDWFREDLGHLFSLLAEGRIAPRVKARLPLDQTALAHRRLAAGERGKFVLLPWA